MSARSNRRWEVDPDTGDLLWGSDIGLLRINYGDFYEDIADGCGTTDIDPADETQAAHDALAALVQARSEPRAEGPKPFVLVRDDDVTGVSGTGVVAEGVMFSGGVIALRWTSDWPTSVVFHDRGLESVLAVHGHGGKTRVEWR